MYGQIIQAPAGISSATLGGEALTDLVLSPSSTVISFDDLSIFRIGAGVITWFSEISRQSHVCFFLETMAPSSALPIGAARVVSEMQPVAIDPAQPGSGLLNAVLALLSPPNPDENERYDEEILDLTVTGFLIMSVGRRLNTFIPHVADWFCF
jgi:polyribonucleotide 5'-hydroxyl-kinase